MKSQSKLMQALRTAVFVLVLLLILPLMLLWQLWLFIYFSIGGVTEAKRRHVHRTVCVTSRRVLRCLPGVRVDVKGNPEEAFSEPAIVVSNHQSHIDLLVMLSLSPRIVFMAKKWVWRNPLYCFALRYIECVSSDDGPERNLAQISDLAARGYSTVIFPEGTRSEDCRVHRFHKGAFWIADRLGMAILPVYIKGTGLVMNKRSLAISPGDIAIEIGERIPYSAQSDPSELRRRVQADFKSRIG